MSSQAALCGCFRCDKKRGMVEAKGGRFSAKILPNMDETNAQVAAVS
jgi:hypothetical protein